MADDPDPDGTRARRERLEQLARQHVESFVGLDVQDAHRRAGHLGLTLRAVEAGGRITQEYRFGRITASVRDGRITGATVG